MNLASKLPIVLGAIALTGVAYVFVNQASPYLTIAEAKTHTGSRVHLPGDILKETLFVDTQNRLVKFTIKDKAGATMNVVYSGQPPANMGQATGVVAIGKAKDGVFYAEDMLLKCPSKYKQSQYPAGMQPVEGAKS